MEQHEQSIFAVVAAARNFLWDVAPFRRTESEVALQKFLHVVPTRKLPAFILRSLLLEVLRFLDRYTGGRIPTLVERFSRECREDRDCLSVFARSVGDVFRYGGIGHPLVQQTIAIAEEHHGDHNCSPTSIARALKTRPSSLDVTCRKEIGLTLGDILREARLKHAVSALTTTAERIKVISAAAGYKHESTFNHDFRSKFDTTPGEYRRRAIVPVARHANGCDTPGSRPHGLARSAEGGAIARPAAILVVDDDEGMRVTMARYLRRRGYEVVEAATGYRALQEAVQKRFQLFVIDLHMQDMSGLECLGQLRRERAGHKVSAMIATMDPFALDELRTEAAALDATMHWKLSDAETFCDHVDQIIGRS